MVSSTVIGGAHFEFDAVCSIRRPAALERDLELAVSAIQQLLCAMWSRAQLVPAMSAPSSLSTYGIQVPLDLGITASIFSQVDNRPSPRRLGPR
ncbi:MAG: hypothetical protein U1E65_05450 [Myxococcota bacterium]